MGTEVIIQTLMTSVPFDLGRNRWLALLWLVMLGGLIEIAQGLWAVNRATDPWDLLANSLGIALAAAVCWRRNALLAIERIVA